MNQHASALSRRAFGRAAGAVLAVALTRPAWAKPLRVAGRIRRLDPALDEVIAADSPVEEIASGFQWAEGPVWVKRQRCLLFSDVPKNVAWMWTPAGGARPFLDPSGIANPDPTVFREPGSNGMVIDAKGALLMADCGHRAIARVDLATKRKTLLAERYQGRRFNSPNDLVVARDGTIYFTDPPYGLNGLDASPAREQPHNGVYRLAADGSVTLVDASLSFPNGLALSLDERRLFVSVSDPAAPRIMAYDLDASGMPSRSRVFFDAMPLMGPNVPGLPDGMKMAINGLLFASGPGGMMILDSRAKLLGVIENGRPIANCCFGEDGRSLFMTSEHSVARLRLKVRGA